MKNRAKLYSVIRKKKKVSFEKYQLLEGQSDDKKECVKTKKL
jgi:hypothetical protein